MKVETRGCAKLRPDRVEQLLRLELATLVPVVSELPTLDVDFVCTHGLVSITLKDPITVKMVTRDVSLEASPDPERTLALAASELFLASWAELLIARPENTGRAPEPPGASAAKRAVERVVVPVRPTFVVDLGAMARERDVSAPILTFGAAVRLGVAGCIRPQIFADAGWETGSTSRPSGRVDISAVVVGMGARWCLRFGGTEFGAYGSVSADYISLQGVPSSPSFYGAHREGLTAEASVGIDAGVTIRAVRLGASVLLGALAPGPVGDVAGGTSVRFDGPWLGAKLFAGLLL